MLITENQRYIAYGRSSGGDQPESGNSSGSAGVVFEGGPPIGFTLRNVEIPASCQTLKVEYYGGYEHFERVEPIVSLPSAEPVTFRWTTRTRIAE